MHKRPSSTRPVSRPGRRHRLARGDQRGSVLITTLALLFVVTMLLLSAMRTNTANERMAGNARDWNTAFQAAEAALRDAERDIGNATRITGATGFTDGCSAAGLCKVSATGRPAWQILNDSDTGWKIGTDDASQSRSVKYGTYTAKPAIAGVAMQPRYIIEVMVVDVAGSKKITAQRNPKYFYRVTAVGFGANVSSRVMLQAVIRP
jgi:type IV pilus assembly protein PilX